MKRMLRHTMVSLIMTGLCAGCLGARTPTPLSPSVQTSILVMPVTHVEPMVGQMLRDQLVQEMTARIATVIVDDVEDDMLSSLGVEHPDSFGSLDFSGTSEGARRREQLQQSYGGDLIIFMSAFLEAKQKTDVMHIYMQLVDMETGDVVLNLSAEGVAHADNLEGSTKPLVQNLAREMAKFLRD